MRAERVMDGELIKKHLAGECALPHVGEGDETVAGLEFLVREFSLGGGEELPIELRGLFGSVQLVVRSRRQEEAGG